MNANEFVMLSKKTKLSKIKFLMKNIKYCLTKFNKFTCIKIVLFCYIPSCSFLAFTLIPEGGYKIRTIVIDAGHGGKDAGCHGQKYYEKDVALKVSLKLGKYIEDNYKNVKVIYTRKTDIFLELGERAKIANDAKADFFICIHCNSASYKKGKKIIINPVPCGAETYVKGLHKTKGNLDVAKRENESILLEDNYQNKYDGFDPSSDEAAIVFSMFQNIFLEKSLSLASKIQHQYREKSKREDRGVKQAGFLVLWKTAMPSLLTEIGFLSNPDDERLIGSDKGQDLIARALFNAFKEYKNEVEDNRLTDQVKALDIEVPKDLPEIKLEERIEDNDLEYEKIEKDTTERKVDVEEKAVLKVSETAKMNSEITFKVQFMNSDKKIPLNSPKFSDINEVSEMQSGVVYKYFSGNYSRLENAVETQTKLRGKGYKDAFLVAFNKGEKITLNEAKRLLENK